jgi:chromosome segregation ATPase
VTHADAEVASMLRVIEERKTELTSKQARATKLRQQIDALRRQIATLDIELESIVKEQSRFVDEVLKPAQATVEQTTSDALALSEELMAVEGKLEELKAYADTFEPASLHYNFELKSFQSKFGQI